MPVEENTESTETTETTETNTETTQEPTLAEVEAMINAEYDRERGRDVTKFVGYKAPETKTEVKGTKEETGKDDKKESADGDKGEKDTKEAPKADVEKEEPKKLTRFERRVLKATRTAQEENRVLRERLAVLEAAGKPKEEVTKSEPPLVEPQRGSFKTDAEYFAAVRAYDKAVNAAEVKRLETEAAQRAANAEFQARIERYNGRIEEARKKYDDWDKVNGSATDRLGRETGDKQADAEYNTAIVGVLMESGPETSYHLAKIPKGAETFSKLDLTGVIAAGNADDPQRVILHLASHPEDIRSLNGMSPVKAQNFIGKIEARLENAATSEKTKATPKAEVKDTSSNGAPKKTEPKAEPSKEETTRKKPEPPPALRGTAPAAESWKDERVTSFKEFERLYNEDPANRRR